MSGGCSVLGCESKKRRKYEGVSFHQFPKDEETRKKWSAATGRKNWEPNRRSRICSIHFEEDCYHRSESISLLKKFAFPTLFLYDPSQNASPVSVNNMNNYDDHLNISSPVEIKHDPFDEDIKPVSETEKPSNVEIPYPGNSYVVLTTKPTGRAESKEDGIIPYPGNSYVVLTTKPTARTESIEDGIIPYPGNSYVVLTTKPTGRTASIEDGIKIKDNGSTNLEVCRVCLAVGCKMFRLNGQLSQAYTQVTGIPVSSYDGLPQLLCWECAARVLSAVKLCDRATKTHKMLSSLLALSGSINMQDIRSVDRGQMKLMTSLKCEMFKDTQYNNIIDIIEVEKSYNSDDNIKIDKNTQPFRNESKDNDDDAEYENEVGENDASEKYKNEIDEDDDDKSAVDEDDDDDVNHKSDVDEEDDDDKYKSDVDEDDFGDKYKSGSDQHDNDEEIDKNNQEIKKDTSMDFKSVNGSHKAKRISKLEEFFTITAVKLEDAKAAVQSRKQSEAYIDAPFKCEVCYRGYYYKHHYDRHAMKHTENFGSLECAVCKFRYETKRRLDLHTSCQHRREYSCKQCDFVTGSSTRASNHRQVHAGALFPCPHCPKLLNQKTSYYSHIRFKHACSFACELCGHTFLSAFGVKQHKLRQHKLDDLNIEGPFCDTCDLTFATRDAYDTHLMMSSRHNNDNRLSEVNSYQKSRTKDGTKQAREWNQRRKSTKRAVTCEKCGVTLDSRQLYAYHFRNVHPGETRTQHFKWIGANPTVCDQCGRTFSCLASLKEHMSVHTGERLKCDHCEKTFTGKFNLYIHLKIHDPSRPSYPCELCGKRFHFSGNLKRHIQSHTKATPFECEACGKRVTTRTGLQAHIDHVHSGRPWPKRVRLRQRP